MKKNLFKRAMMLALCATTAFSVVGCGGSGDDGDSSGTPTKEVDSSKTQIQVMFYNSGYGDKWPYELAAAFEEAAKDVVFEDGKVGVQVHPKGEKSDVTAQQIKSGDFDVYFMEGPTDYNNMLASKAFEPLDSIVNAVSPYDGEKIVDKLNAQQQDFYSYDAGDGDHYYTLPHYAGNYSIIYNIDLFEENGFYFAETPDADTGDRLIGKSGATKSAGPDGKKGTGDDGLPTTYEEFYYLCREINANGIDPICFPGMYSGQHLSLAMDSLAAQYEGSEQWNLNYTFNGTAKNLIKVNSDGSPMVDGNGNPVFEETDTEINSDNAYLLSRQAGYYYAFSFFETILGDTRYYNEEDGQNTGITHKMMEQGFLEYGKLGTTESAMLVDGTWWQMDAASTFDRLTKEDAKWSKENRRFGLMTLPQPTQADADAVANGTKKPVFTDTLNAACGVKAGLPTGKKNAALAFVQYAYSNQALAEFTYSTGAPIGVDYLDTVDKTKLNPWEKSVIEYMENADIVYAVSSTPRYQQNISNFRFKGKYSTALGTIESAVWTSGYSTGDYFKAFQTHFKGIAWAS